MLILALGLRVSGSGILFVAVGDAGCNASLGARNEGDSVRGLFGFLHGHFKKLPLGVWGLAPGMMGMWLGLGGGPTQDCTGLVLRNAQVTFSGFFSR